MLVEYRLRAFASSKFIQWIVVSDFSEYKILTRVSVAALCRQVARPCVCKSACAMLSDLESTWECNGVRVGVRSMRKFIGLVVIVLLLIGGFVAYSYASEPSLSDYKSLGQKYDVKILRDTWGVPHI